MAIVCDTDFSRDTQETVRTAAALAQRYGEKLHLVHVVDELGSELMVGREEDAMFQPERELLRREADTLRQRGVRVEERLVAGLGYVRLTEISSICQARLLVISHRHEGWVSRLFGGTVHRTVRMSDVPVLVFAGSERLVGWMQGESRLRVLLGIDRSVGSRAALHWLDELGRVGPLETHVAIIHRKCGLDLPWTRSRSVALTGATRHPCREQSRVGARSSDALPGAPPPDDDIDAWLRDLEGATSRIEVVTSRPAAELLHLTRQEQIDLLVIARDLARGRGWQEPAWRAVVRSSLPCSVVCVPATYTPAEVSKPRRRTVKALHARRRRPRIRPLGVESG